MPGWLHQVEIDSIKVCSVSEMTNKLCSRVCVQQKRKQKFLRNVTKSKILFSFQCQQFSNKSDFQYVFYIFPTQKNYHQLFIYFFANSFPKQSLALCSDRANYEGRRETYMELAAELALGAELDVDALVEAEPYQIQRLLHRHVLLRRHRRRRSYSLPPPRFAAEA